MLYRELQRISKLKRRLIFTIFLLLLSVYLNILKYHEFEFINEENRILVEEISDMEIELDSMKTVLTERQKDTLIEEPKVKKIVKKEAPKELIDTNKNNLNIKVIEQTSDHSSENPTDTLNH